MPILERMKNDSVSAYDKDEKLMCQVGECRTTGPSSELFSKVGGGGVYGLFKRLTERSCTDYIFPMEVN